MSHKKSHDSQKRNRSEDRIDRKAQIHEQLEQRRYRQSHAHRNHLDEMLDDIEDEGVTPDMLSPSIRSKLRSW